MTDQTFCQCRCHDGVAIFCSCFVDCCHEVRKPRSEQTPRPKREIKIGPFTKFIMPVITNTKAKPKPIRDIFKYYPMMDDEPDIRSI